MNSWDPTLDKAMGTIATFVEENTGQAPTPDELARALTRYFVLTEILDFIKMSREEQA